MATSIETALRLELRKAKWIRVAAGIWQHPVHEKNAIHYGPSGWRHYDFSPEFSTGGFVWGEGTTAEELHYHLIGFEGHYRPVVDHPEVLKVAMATAAAYVVPVGPNDIRLVISESGTQTKIEVGANLPDVRVVQNAFGYTMESGAGEWQITILLTSRQDAREAWLVALTMVDDVVSVIQPASGATPYRETAPAINRAIHDLTARAGWLEPLNPGTLTDGN